MQLLCSHGPNVSACSCFKKKKQFASRLKLCRGSMQLINIQLQPIFQPAHCAKKILHQLQSLSRHSHKITEIILEGQKCNASFQAVHTGRFDSSRHSHKNTGSHFRRSQMQGQFLRMIVVQTRI
jgi:hypothetical protein